jgi:hypothetical protein
MTPSGDEEGQLAARVRTMQIIVLAMLIGSATAVIILAFLQLQRPAQPADAVPLVTYIALAFTVLTIVLSFVIPAMVIAGARRRIAKGAWQPTTSPGDAVPLPANNTVKLLAIYHTALIMGAAWLESQTFFLAIAYFREGQILSLVAAGVLIGALAARFPTQARVAAWLERQLGLIDQERQSSTSRD